MGCRDDSHNDSHLWTTLVSIMQGSNRLRPGYGGLYIYIFKLQRGCLHVFAEAHENVRKQSDMKRSPGDELKSSAMA